MLRTREQEEGGLHSEVPDWVLAYPWKPSESSARGNDSL